MVDLTIESASCFGTSRKIGEGLKEIDDESKDLKLSDDDDDFAADSFAQSFAGQTSAPNKLAALNDLLKNKQLKLAEDDEDDFEQFLTKLH